MKFNLLGLARLKTQTKTRTQALALRINALQWRERLILFVLLSTVVGVLLDALVIIPLQSERKAQLRTQAVQVEALKTLRLQLTQALMLSNADSVPSQLLQGIRQHTAEAVSLEQQIATLAKANVEHSTTQEELPILLTELLRQQVGLTLVKLNTISDAPKFTDSLPLDGWQWQGVELRVAGDYLALLRYLRQLEKALPGLRWGEMKLSAPVAGPVIGRTASQSNAQPALLQLQVFLLKAKR